MDNLLTSPNFLPINFRKYHLLWGIIGDMQELFEGLVEFEGIFYPPKQNPENFDISYPSDGLKNLNLVEDESYWYWHRNRCIAHQVEKHCSGLPFLDIGGGNGPVSKFLQNRGVDSILVEPDKTGCQNALSRGVKKIVQGKIGEITFREGCEPFSVGMFDVIEHIEDDQTLIKQVCELLSKDGILIATVPASKFLWSKADVHAGHYRRYTTKSFSDLLENSGFEIIEIHKLFSILLIPIFLFRVIPSYLGLYSGKKNTNERDHASGKGRISRVLKKILTREFNSISQGKRRRFGSSILVVAKKINHFQEP